MKTKLLSLSLLLASTLVDAAPQLQISPPPPADTIDCSCLPQVLDAGLLGGDLNSVTLQQNSYYSPTLAVNPKNNDNLVVTYSVDRFRDSSGVYLRGGFQTNIAYSNDGGNTWATSTPAPTVCLGGTVSPVTSGLVYRLSYSPKGTLYFGGDFNDTKPFGSRSTTQSGIFVQRSDDGGATWSPAVIIDLTNSAAFAAPINQGGFVGGAGYLNTGLGSIVADEFNHCLVHVSWSRIFFSGDDNNTLYGNIWYSRSQDGGKTFAPATMIYDMVNDPVWTANHADNDFFPLGGQSAGGTIVSVPKKGNKQTLLNGFVRLYPKVGSTSYSQVPSDSNFDHAVVASYDNGETWSQTAFELPQYIFSVSHDPRFPATFDATVNDGSLNTPMAVSPKTNRVYMAWQGGNSVLIPDPEVNQFFPRIELSRSIDSGQTWSNIVQVNTTPNNFANPGSSQAFNPNLVVLPNGLLGVIYEDFRNYDGVSTTNVPTNAWIDVYKETANPTGGSTGIGLDFVETISLTPIPFNAAIGFDSIIIGVGADTGIANRKCQFATVFGKTIQGDLETQRCPFPPGGFVDANNRLSVFFEQVKP